MLIEGAGNTVVFVNQDGIKALGLGVTEQLLILPAQLSLALSAADCLIVICPDDLNTVALRVFPAGPVLGGYALLVLPVRAEPGIDYCLDLLSLLSNAKTFADLIFPIAGRFDFSKRLEKRNIMRISVAISLLLYLPCISGFR